MSVRDEIKRMVERIESLLNKEIPGTPRLTGRQPGGRVLYLAIPGRGKNRAALTARAQQVLAFINRHRGKVTAAQIQEGLDVNRNVVAGAIHELKKARLVRSSSVAPVIEVAAEHVPRKRRPKKPKARRTNGEPAAIAADKK